MSDFTITPTAVGTGSISPSAPQVVAEGSAVSFAAIPGAGMKFDYWTGVATNENSSDALVIADEDKTVTAYFIDASLLTTFEIEVCNRALGLLHATAIEADNPNDPNYLDCQLYLERAKDDIISAYNWDWATRRQRLTLALDEPLSTYQYSFVLPTDFVCMRDKANVPPSKIDTRYYDVVPSQEYSIENSKYGMCINVNYVDADDNDNPCIDLRYVSNVDLAMYPDCAISAVEYSLAWHVATKTTDKERNNQLLDMLFKMSEMKIASCKSVSSRQAVSHRQSSQIIGRPR